MNRKLILALAALVSLICMAALIVSVGAAWLWPKPDVQPKNQNVEIFQGIHYLRETRNSPRPMVIHVVTIDLRQNGLSFLVTPGDPHTDLPLKARTTSQFLTAFDLQLAVNGDVFEPWSSNGPLDYYPHAGDPVAPSGYAASRGMVYSRGNAAEPTLYISKTNAANFHTPIGKIYNAISGERMLVEKGKNVVEISQDEDIPQPRTAIGLDKSGKHLFIVVVDGRQSGYSEGITLKEFAEILIQYKTFYAMNLDGGGSSTLAIQRQNGNPELLNSPIDSGIPGRERPVGNHIGVFAKPVKRK